MMARRRLPLPTGPVADVVLREISPGDRAALGPEDARVLGELARAAPLPRPSSMPAALVVAGTHDPLLPREAARAFAAGIGADHVEIEGGHWLIVGSGWQACVGAVHRWLVRRGGDALLELYEEAMAERGDDDAPA
jgi:pimeloyl-ACP methyl ester carboxylesterase